MKNWFLVSLFFLSISVFAQVTKSSISGTVKSSKGETLPGVNVEIKHIPSGTKYYANTDFNGAYSAPAVKPGGPYTVKASFIGYKPSIVEEVNAPLGSSITVNLILVDELTKLDEVVVTTTRSNRTFSKNRNGASQQFSNREINAVPVLGSRSIAAVTKYNANAGSGGTFGGQDSRLNNVTIDGSVFNNGFGLGSEAQAGGRTGSTAISLDAIEQIQVNIAPYDVRQTGFTGSGINAVTRSGSNEIEGSVYHSFRSNDKTFVGTKAGDVEIVPAKFEEKIWGARIGAPIIKDKLFFFGSFETVDKSSPATNWTSTGSPLGGAQVSAPTYTEMQSLSNYLGTNFNYQTGPWENFDAISTSKKFLGRLDWNINNDHKLTMRYVHHDSGSDELISNSTSLGQGNRRTNANSMAYKNSGYVIEDNTRSIVLELDSKLSEKWSNNFMAGFDKQIEDRGLQGSFFPTVDVKNGANNYISFGLDPFTPGNKLNYSTLHFTNNITGLFGKHTLLFGANYERFKSENLFFPGSNGVYIFDSLQDFYDAADESLALGGLPSVNNLPSRFQFRYSALNGGAEPMQIMKSDKIDLYAQDEYKVYDNFKLTFGLRVSRISFEDTALENPAVTGMTFMDGQKFNTGEMSKTQYLFEPRIGFNLDVDGKSNTQVRGGTGIFTGRPPFVFLSNAIGNNGVLTGFVDVSGANVGTGGYNGTGYGFTANPNQYFIPSTPTLPTTFDLAFTDRNFKFPQVWKSNVALDQRLPFGFIGTVEGIFSKNINAVHYYNANLDAPVGTFSGVDDRPRYARNDNGVRINDNVSNAIVLTNTDEGYFYSTTFKLEYPYKNGLWGSFAYTHSSAYDLLSAGSIASGSWTGARSVLGNNDLSVSLSNNNTPHRLVGVLGYKIDYGKTYGGSTSINLGYIGEKTSPFTYSYGGDMNGDRINNNDLIFVPLRGSDIRFQPLTVGSVVYSEADQQAAYDRYIEQDPYLSTRRGQYAERNAVELPMLHRIDLSVTQDFYIKIAGKKNAFQFRADILNFTNLLNNDWGISKRATNTNVLNYRTTNASNVPFFQLATQTNPDGSRELIRQTFQKNASINDVWQAQFTLRYTFGK
ncbi:TonB-dependent receptor [Flavobacterium sp. H122]|uniref:TonB-dependent receptor n=1 Tax=Flavobacterium sp. H122 TaxID=2529860 RepID=UPI0010AABF98|nr:carboxypeptidase regulatory-like domain-containing protein [Flavobacterium sp. H122]